MTGPEKVALGLQQLAVELASRGHANSSPISPAPARRSAS